MSNDKQKDVQVSIEPSRYAPNKVLIIRIGNREVSRTFIHDKDVSILEEWIVHTEMEHKEVK